MEILPTSSLPAIPAKRYFTIGEVSELCGVKPHVLRYWEQEFTQLKPLKRRGNRRYYQHHEVLLIRRIRELLYEHGFTINGARNRLEEPSPGSLRRGGDAIPAGQTTTLPRPGFNSGRGKNPAPVGAGNGEKTSQTTGVAKEGARKKFSLGFPRVNKRAAKIGGPPKIARGVPRR